MPTVVQAIVQKVVAASFLESFMLLESTRTRRARLPFFGMNMQDKFPVPIMTIAIGAIFGEEDLHEFHGRLNASAAYASRPPALACCVDQR